MAQHNLELKQRWQQLVNDNPRTRIRDAAEILDVSEMELLATDMPQKVLMLEGDFKALMQRLTKVGKIMSLVRNDVAVHELSGIYPTLQYSGDPQVGVAMEAIDLCIHFNEYRYAFAVRSPQGKHELRSIQTSDKCGQALQTIYLKNRDHVFLWDEIVEHFTAQQQKPTFDLGSAEPVSRSFVDIDLTKLKQEWQQMQHAQDLSEIIKRLGISQHEAVSFIGQPYNRKVEIQAINQLIEQIKEQAIACSVLVRNKGVTQIYSGRFHKTAAMGAWMNVLDPNFNLHILTSAVEDVWVVKKPTQQGLLTSLEAYDKKGRISLEITPINTSEKQDLTEWHQVLEKL